jgi:MoxR-like ATPase
LIQKEETVSQRNGMESTEQAITDGTTQPNQLSASHKLSAEEAAQAREELRRVRNEIERVIVGKREVLDLLLTAFLARGHVLIEDIPGVGKTTMAKALAQVIGGSFKRIQFTPDLLPGDVTGLTLWNQKTSEWIFTPGPVFANVLLADEINRATPKTQSALLESMEEAQVTIDGRTHRLPQPFFVLATQNPVEYRGTYPLPEAQMDRFLLRARLGYPRIEEERELLLRHANADSAAATASLEHKASLQPKASIEHATASEATSNGSGNKAPEEGVAGLLQRVQTCWSSEQARAVLALRARVWVAPPVQEYIVNLVTATRDQTEILLGASPRASVALQRAAQGAALLQGRHFVEPDDVKRLAAPVLAHRLILQGAGSVNHTLAESLVARLLEDTPVP